MILILSEDRDETTSSVIDWLHKFKAPYIRINQEDTVAVNFCTPGSFELLINEEVLIHSKSITSFWYRRGFFASFKGHFSGNDTYLLSSIRNHLSAELIALNDFLFFLLKGIPGLGNYKNSHLNKIEQLNRAQALGIKIPDTMITSKKEVLLEFILKHNSVITKSIDSPLTIAVESKNYMTYTEAIDEDFARNLPDFFAPSLFQANIIKRYEIRSFYLDGDFYSMAIFSQKNDQTAVDFRKYDFKVPNRTTKFQLPKFTEDKLRKLIEYYELDTCSVDLIVTNSMDFVFLEINPVGQFGMVSMPCNYQLEKKVALSLINKGK
ncbi:MAG: grasp-with-spasm system ATP-grasp peptide maturase [Chryseotalea sp.]|jgi:ATP-GRASP peptide maturase of grasp-with-spasm system|nr:grasp-with-spasm system ATP-grasp peptide maturase [Cytophagales bacterium]